MKQLTVGVIGCGYWGPKLIRNFSASARWDLKYACDLLPDLLEQVKASYPGVTTTESAGDVFGDSDVDVVAVATPVSTHFDLASRALQAGKHVWVEKPLTASSEEGRALIELAARHNLLLHVDHTFVYTAAVRKIKELISAGEIGDIYYLDSMRVNLGLFQHDVNVIWDLAPHDLSILRYCIGKEPVSVTANGIAHFTYEDRSLENIAYITVNFTDDFIAHFNVNWLSPVKVRQILIGGSRKMLVFNDLEPIEKIKVYDYGVEIESREDIYQTLIQYRTGDMYSPNLQHMEALRFECEHFADCIEAGKPTDTDGEDGLYVVKIIEAANESLSRDGAAVALTT